MAKEYHSIALATSAHACVSRDMERQMHLNARSPAAPQPLFLLHVWVYSLW